MVFMFTTLTDMLPPALLLTEIEACGVGKE
jgi:hypothetical protein